MIEQHIQELTRAIRELTVLLSQAQHQAIAPVAAPSPTPAPTPAPTEEPAEVTEAPKRRGRPPKPKDEPVVQPERVVEPEPTVEQEPEADDFFEPEPPVEITVETLRAAIRDCIVAGGKEREDANRKAIGKILAQFNGAKTLPELPVEVYPSVLKQIRAIG